MQQITVDVVVALQIHFVLVRDHTGVLAMHLVYAVVLKQRPVVAESDQLLDLAKLLCPAVVFVADWA